MEQVATGRKVRVIPASRKTEAAERRAKTGVKRVAAYCRVSTDTEEQINSYEAQKAYYTQLIEENPEWEMAGVFAEAGVIIGLNFLRLISSAIAVSDVIRRGRFSLRRGSQRGSLSRRRDSVTCDKLPPFLLKIPCICDFTQL